MTRALVTALVVLAACTDPEPTFDYPKDGERTLFHVQSRGTHNSYHIEPPNNDVPEWMYSHDPLDVFVGQKYSAPARESLRPPR